MDNKSINRFIEQKIHDILLIVMSGTCIVCPALAIIGNITGTAALANLGVAIGALCILAYCILLVLSYFARDSN